ncbi:hypothetical protein IMAU80006_03157 [Lactiplantibacillus plantarum]|jgi:hypothetical protein|nr:hypothetical protein [Lactiplantibacillus plantarum]
MKRWKKTLFVILGMIIILFVIGAIYFYLGN